MQSRRRSTHAILALTGLAAAALAALDSPSAGAARPIAAAQSVKPPTPGTIFVLNLGPSSITAYSKAVAEPNTPLTTIKGSRAALTGATDLAVTASGMLWVTIPPTNAVQEYAGGATGNVKPVARLTGPKTKLHSPVALALDHAGDLWVLNDNISDSSASILEFRPGAAGNVAPIRRIAGSATRLFPAGGIAVSADGSAVWVTHVEAGSGLTAPALQRFSASATGNVAPALTISGARTELDYPASLVVARSGAVTVASDPDRRKASALLVFGRTAAGNAVPTRTITGRLTTLDAPAFVGIDAQGRVWAPNATSPRIARFAPVAAGDVAPTRTIVGKAAGLTKPRAVAVQTAIPGPPRHLTVKEVAHRRLQVSWGPPTSTGGGLQGYTLFRREGAKQPVHHTALGVIRSATTGPLTRHHHYTFFVRAKNNAGVSADSGTVVVRVH